jgi:mannose-6-phosphate isomerase-like protein (cupin superfamily)
MLHLRTTSAFAAGLLIAVPSMAVLGGHQQKAGQTGAGYILQTDAAVAAPEPGSHNGGGETTAYKFFDKIDGMNFTFRKRALHPGSAIGYHLQNEDEVYYVLSGMGVMTVNGKSFDVGPGSAVLTRPGNSHGLVQKGGQDLVVIIAYENRR